MLTTLELRMIVCSIYNQLVLIKLKGGLCNNHVSSGGLETENMFTSNVNKMDW